MEGGSSTLEAPKESHSIAAAFKKMNLKPLNIENALPEPILFKMA